MSLKWKSLVQGIFSYFKECFSSNVKKLCYVIIIVWKIDMVT